MHARPASSTRRRVPVGVLVPCSGSKAMEATLARTLTRSAAPRTTVLISTAPPPQTAGGVSPQLHCAARPVWTTQQVAPGASWKLMPIGWLRATASVRTNCTSAASAVAAASRRRPSMNATRLGTAAVATTATTATTTIASISEKPRGLRFGGGETCFVCMRSTVEIRDRFHDPVRRGSAGESRRAAPWGPPRAQPAATLKCPGSAGGTRRRLRSCDRPRRNARRRPCRCA